MDVYGLPKDILMILTKNGFTGISRCIDFDGKHNFKILGEKRNFIALKRKFIIFYFGGKT